MRLHRVYMGRRTLIFKGFGRFGEDLDFYVGISVHKQCSLLDTMFNYMFYFGFQENIYKQVEKTDYPSAGFAGRGVVGFGDLSIDIFLEVQIKTNS